MVLIWVMGSAFVQAQISVGYLSERPAYDSLDGGKPTLLYPRVALCKDLKKKWVTHALLDGYFGGSKSFNQKLRAGGLLEMTHKHTFLRVGVLSGWANSDFLYHRNDAFVFNHKTTLDPMIRAVWSPNPHFTLQGGWDRNFYGEGSRSLFLSDYGKPYPFLSSQMKLGPLRYQMMCSFLKTTMSQRKYNMTHHLDWQIGKKVNVQIFESIIFNSQDSTTQRNFEPEYLNPFVFFRPQEYAVGSGDNVLLGLGLSLKLGKGQLYSQLIVDEFLLSAFKANNQYWGNKYGLQLGYKQPFNWLRGACFGRVEMNALRPYLYSHIHDGLSYSHGQAVLAHPLGSNLGEVLGELTWKKDRLSVFCTVVIGTKGVDTANVNFGGNVFLPYTTRPQDYGVGWFNGAKSHFQIAQIQVQYAIKKTSFMAFVEMRVKHESLNKASFWLLAPAIGLRSALWNDYRNY